MAAHRYWRFVINSIDSGTQTIVDNIEFRVSSGSANLSLTGNGTASDNSHNGAADASNAFDGANSTYWSSLTPVTLPVWAQWDFGVGNEQDIGYVTVKNSPFGTGSVITGTVQFSDDASAWTDWIIYAGTAAAGVATSAQHADPGSATVAAVSPAMTMASYGGANSVATTPQAVLTVFGGGSASPNAPAPVVHSASGVQANSVPPTPTLLFTGHNSTGKQAAYLTAPSPLLAANGGANAKLTNPTQTLAATGTTTLVARATLTAPSQALSSAGTGAFVAGANLKAPSPNLVGYGGAVCSITLTGKATLQATGTTGGVAGATLTCPLSPPSRLSAQPTCCAHHPSLAGRRKRGSCHPWARSPPSARLSSRSATKPMR